MRLRAGQEDLQTGQWTPPVDIFENAEAIVLRVDLPGVGPEGFELRLEDGALLLRGKRKSPGEAPREEVLRAERPHGTFARSFTLPSNVDPSGIRATQRNGVLEVILPKKQEVRAQTIRVETK